MKQVRDHIIFKYISLILVLAILTPSLVKVLHAFEDHNHEVCTEKSTTHLHELDLECEFYKFKLNNTFSLSSFEIDLLVNKNNRQSFSSSYNFIGLYIISQNYLRGPPQIV